MDDQPPVGYAAGYRKAGYDPIPATGRYTELDWMSSESSSLLDPEQDEQETKEQFDGRWNKGLKKINLIQDTLKKYEELSSLSKDFVHTAELYAKIIISELYIPASRRTVIPVTLGGIAGGEKYSCQGILFKFALDTSGMYGGDQNAMKVAGHELKGLMCYYNCQIPELFLPLMALVDYRGFRVVAISLLPVSKETIIYGSYDAGETVHADDAKFNAMMKLAGKFLNLKEHIVGPPSSPTKLYGPADIEGHRSQQDGCYYLLDFARTMPPQAPIDTKRGEASASHLYELLRPELVKKSLVPLSSDAFCGFQNSDSNAKTHNKEVYELCNNLFFNIIPTFDSENKSKDEATPMEPELQSRWIKKKEDISGLELVQSLHREGINLRHLGLLRDSAKTARIKNIILIEMVSRMFKDEINMESRKAMQASKTPTDQLYRQIILDFLNGIFLFQREQYWTTSVKKLIAKKYRYGLSKEENDIKFNLLTVIHVPSLMKRFSEITNIKIETSATEVLEFGSSEIVDSDLGELGVKVKKMNVITEATAMVLYHAALQRNGTEAERIFQEAINKFKEAISASPNSRFAYYEFGKMLHTIAIKVPSDDDAIMLLTAAIQKLEYAVTIDQHFDDGKIALADVLLDFITHKKRLWLLYRKDDKSLFQALLSKLARVAQLLKSVLRGPMNISEDSKKALGSSRKRKASILKVQQLIQCSPDLKILALLQVSSDCKPVRKILETLPELAEKKTFSVTQAGCVIYIPSTFELIPKTMPKLTSLTLHHSTQMTQKVLRSLLSSLPDLKTFEISGCDNIGSFPLSIAINLLELNIYAISDLKITEFVPLPNLTMLGLSGSNISDSQLQELLSKTLSLKILKIGRERNQLGNTMFCPSITNPLLRCKELNSFDLSGCGSLTDDALICIAKNATITSVDVSGCLLLTDESFSILIKKHKMVLENCFLNSTKITDSTIKALVGVKNLKNLSVELCRSLKGSVFKNIIQNNKQIQQLSIGYLNNDIVDQKAWKTLNSQNSSLTSLDLSGWNIADNDIDLILTSCVNISTLILVGCYQLSDKSIVQIGEKLNIKLRVLSLQRCVVVSSNGLVPLIKDCPNLRRIDLGHCSEINGLSLQALAENCPQLTSLKINNCSKIKGPDIQSFLFRSQALEELNLIKKKYEKKRKRRNIQSFLFRSQALEELSLSGLDISPNFISELRHRCNYLLIFADVNSLNPKYHL